jgi:hypothetical protein
MFKHRCFHDHKSVVSVGELNPLLFGKERREFELFSGKQSLIAEF